MKNFLFLCSFAAVARTHSKAISDYDLHWQKVSFSLSLSLSLTHLLPTNENENHNERKLRWKKVCDIF